MYRSMDINFRLLRTVLLINVIAISAGGILDLVLGGVMKIPIQVPISGGIVCSMVHKVYACLHHQSGDIGMIVCFDWIAVSCPISEQPNISRDSLSLD